MLCSGALRLIEHENVMINTTPNNQQQQVQTMSSKQQAERDNWMVSHSQQFIYLRG
jgi:hypothetical protein